MAHTPNYEPITYRGDIRKQFVDALYNSTDRLPLYVFIMRGINADIRNGYMQQILDAAPDISTVVGGYVCASTLRAKRLGYSTAAFTHDCIAMMRATLDVQVKTALLGHPDAVHIMVSDMTVPYALHHEIIPALQEVACLSLDW